MNNLVNVVMPVFTGKKEIVVGSKVSQSENEALTRVCEREDRSMSYVLRELAIRGLAHYVKDGQLKVTKSEEDILLSSSLNIEQLDSNLIQTQSKLIKVEHKGKLDDERQTNQLRPQKVTEATGELAETDRNKKRGVA